MRLPLPVKLPVTVNPDPRELMSLLTSFAVALTFLRFGAAHLQAERARERAAGE
jgi:hypothetical protein